MEKIELNELLYKKKNYSEIKELLKNSTEFRSFNILGKIELWTGDLKNAYSYFDKAHNIYGCAYCKFLSGNLGEAEILIRLIKGSSSAVNWLLCLINVIKENFCEEAGYFQIRNFYEQDLSMLFLYNQQIFIEKIIKNINFFENYNKEIYKLTARVLFNNNYVDIAEKMLNKSLNICYKDPETHFIAGELYYTRGDYKKAQKAYSAAIDVNNGYYPAEIRLKEISSRI